MHHSVKCDAILLRPPLLSYVINITMTPDSEGRHGTHHHQEVRQVLEVLGNVFPAWGLAQKIPLKERIAVHIKPTAVSATLSSGLANERPNCLVQRACYHSLIPRPSSLGTRLKPPATQNV